jgi:hypothetical protein
MINISCDRDPIPQYLAQEMVEEQGIGEQNRMQISDSMNRMIYGADVFGCVLIEFRLIFSQSGVGHATSITR